MFVCWNCALRIELDELTFVDTFNGLLIKEREDDFAIYFVLRDKLYC